MARNNYFLSFAVLTVSALLGLASRAAAADAELGTTSQPNRAVPTAAPPIAPPSVPSTTEVRQVTFAQQPSSVGDRVAQTVGVELQVQTTVTQAGQQAHRSQTSLRRRQQRFVEVLEVNAGNVRRAHVTYPLSRVISAEQATPEQDDARPEDAKQEQVQAVEKQSYLVTRDGERLFVTDSEGAIPSQTEFEIVVTSLQNLGLPNPLIKFLLGQTVHVGERLRLPQETAEQLMGFGPEFGAVKQFDLELKSIDQVDGQRCAVFAATIEAVGQTSSPVRIRAFGQVVVQTETCRIVQAELSGPVTLATAEHTPEGSFQYTARGNMRLAVRAQYGHAPK